MKASETKLLEFLKGPKQFIIPIYQRSYSWTIKQCDQLWKDILHAAKDESLLGHFIGSVVYIEKGLYQVSANPQLLVIDGQQRLTTITLLITAIAESLQESAEIQEITPKKMRNYFLLNSDEDGESRYKLLLTQNDKKTLINILENQDLPETPSRQIVENYNFFKEQIAKSKISPIELYKGIAKLIIVDIALDREHDNPQLIFESLNSTGLALSQADLIRNYVLMGLEPKQQEAIYNNHWFPMEQFYDQRDYRKSFDRFIRDYLTVKTGRIPNENRVYEAFKQYTRDKNLSIPEIVADVHKNSKHFVKLAFEQHEDNRVRNVLQDINAWRVDVAYPLILETYNDHAEGLLSLEEFIQILRLIESYVFRRAICEIPTNSLNKTFATLSKEIDKTNYLNSFMAALMLKDSYKRFPSDTEFKNAFVLKDLYHIRMPKYWLTKIENFNRKEPVNTAEFSVEHILPQNPNLSTEWQTELGEDWQEIQAKYLHTPGNLTLTGYNSELSDRPFKTKQEVPGGFKDSPIRLNHGLARLEKWSEAEIHHRGQELAEIASKVWPYTTLSLEDAKKHCKSSTSTSGLKEQGYEADTDSETEEMGVYAL